MSNKSLDFCGKIKSQSEAAGPSFALDRGKFRSSFPTSPPSIHQVEADDAEENIPGEAERVEEEKKIKRHKPNTREEKVIVQKLFHFPE